MKIEVPMSVGGAWVLVGMLGCSGAASPTDAIPTNTGATAPNAQTVAPGQAAAAGATSTIPAATNPMTATVTAGSSSSTQSPGMVPVPAGAAGSPPATATAAAGTGAPSELPSGGDAADWTMMGYDPGSTYFNRAETTLTKDNAAQLDVLWTADLGGNVNGGGLQVGDKVYASGPGVVAAYQAADGKELWKTRVGGTSTLGYSDGVLFIHDNGGSINALKAADGSMLWKKKADPSGADGNSSVIPIGDVVLFGASDGNQELGGGGSFRGYVAMLDAKTGDVRWRTFTVPENGRGASFWSSPSGSIEDGLVFGASGNNYTAPTTDTSDSILAFDWKTGEIKWKYQARMGDSFPLGGGPDSDFGSNPVLYETAISGAMTKMVADGTKYGNVIALKRASGELVWKRDLCPSGSADGSTGLFTNFSYSGKSIVAACNQGGPATMFALDAATGDMLWMQALPGQVWGRMAFANGVGFVGSGSQVMAFDVDTGAMLKTFPSMGGTIASTITISHGRVVFGEGLSWSGGRNGSTLTVLGLK